ncbi:DUF4190 domain-containing protein [Paenibacillus sp. IHBB 10380]|uniref:DUF4190 domain-containing protein n=1 Tax=Paenibacillus sp. IHBB 10380 TaxID=1566358 RepID=UPI0005CFB76B|nr:DUF4190 domain-containing protein [Paenibacillus sp. IHBB 10380]
MNQLSNDLNGPSNNYPPPMPPATTNGKSFATLNGKSFATFVLGILSIAIPYIGFIIGILAIIFGSLSLKELKYKDEQGRGLAIAGLVCGIVGTAIYAIILIILILAMYSTTIEINSY